VLVMPRARGSSSSSSVLAEAIRLRTAPAAIVLGAQDPILPVGAIVADLLYEIAIPIVVVDAFHMLVTGQQVDIDAARGTLIVS
jgi:uncharacterized protein